MTTFMLQVRSGVLTAIVGVFLPQFLRTIRAVLAGVSLFWMGLNMSGLGRADVIQHTNAV